MFMRLAAKHINISCQWYQYIYILLYINDRFINYKLNSYELIKLVMLSQFEEG